MKIVSLVLKIIIVFNFTFFPKIWCMENSKVEEDSQELISGKLKKRLSVFEIINSNTKSLSCIWPKIKQNSSLISYLVLITGTVTLGYYGINFLSSSCGTLQDSCNSCTNQLNQAKDSIAQFSNFTKLLMQLLDNCPAGRVEIIEAFIKLDKDCCK